MSDEFYIGWQTQAPTGIRSHIRKAIVLLAALALGLAVLLALAQKTIGVAAFEWGHLKTFTGILRTDPVPHLVVSQPGHGSGQSAYYLVAPFKFGLDEETIAALDGKGVTLKGTLIYRDNQTMIEAVPDSIKATSGIAPVSLQTVTNFGRQTFVGEIVDSKCYLGVMNPGRLTPHRACAVRCISGGIPPILLVRQSEGPPLCFLLVSAEGRPVNIEVLDMVAEPVEITGEVVHDGSLMILRANPATYQRVKK